MALVGARSVGDLSSHWSRHRLYRFDLRRQPFANRRCAGKPASAVARTAVRTPAGTSTGEASERNQLKRLILLRHADSETNAKCRDHDRPLSVRGRREAAGIAATLKASGWTPDLVLASDSKRSKQTLEEMSSTLDALTSADAHYYGSLYTVAALDGQTRQHLQELISEVATDSHTCILCVGHNKGWEEAASSFAGTAVKLKTATAAVLQCVANSWRDVLKDDAKWELIQVLRPAVQ